MRVSRNIIVAIVWALSLVGVGLYAQGRSDNGQTHIRTPSGNELTTRVLSGDQLGFAIAGPTDKLGRVPGFWVVKTKDGQWVPTTTASQDLGR